MHPHRALTIVAVGEVSGFGEAPIEWAAHICAQNDYEPVRCTAESNHVASEQARWTGVGARAI
jgi:hypothetical protein